MLQKVSQIPNLLTQKPNLNCGALQILKYLMKFLCTCPGVCVCACVCVWEAKRRKAFFQTLLSNPGEYTIRDFGKYTKIYWRNKFYLYLQTVIFFWRWVFIISMHILPQQCKQTPAEPQPCLNYCDTFLCLVNDYLLPCLDQEGGNRELWLIKNFKS